MKTKLFIKAVFACIAVLTTIPAGNLSAQNRSRGAGQTHSSKRNVTVSGHITDAASGETLIGAGAEFNGIGSVTNTYGFYTISVASDSEVTIHYSYIGYEDEFIKFNPQRDTTINVSMKADSRISEAVIQAKKESGIEATKMSAIEVPVSMIKNTPTLFGEADVLKTIQLMPGVQSGAEGFSGIYVRGGGPDENLLLLDGISMYNAEHMLGLFSIFQPEAVKKVTLFKGSFPARYGGRTSSIIDVRTNDGNMQELHGSIGVGLISDKFHLEGPIRKGQTSFSISGRGMHTFMLDGLLKAMKIPANYYFYDLNAKVTHRFSNKDKIFLNVYNGRDIFYYKEKDSDSENNEWAYNDKTHIRWGNTLVSGRWNHVLGGKLFANTTIALTRYTMNMGYSVTDIDKEDGKTTKYHYNFGYDSGMKDMTAKTDFDWTPSSQHAVRFGAEYVHHLYIPETFVSVEQEAENGVSKLDTLFANSKNRNKLGHEASAYIEDDISLGRFTFNPGIHIAMFVTDGKTYWSPEPRMSVKADLGNDISVKAAYSRMSQYVHLLSSSQITLPLDLWVPITKNIKPVTSDQLSAGCYYNGLRGWEFSLEAYWKEMHNVLEYKDGVSFLGNSQAWEQNVVTGNGQAYGIELFIQKTIGETTGWLGYTLAKSDRIFPDGSINNGDRFPYRYDRRHNVSLVLNQQISDKVDLSATWTFATGGTTTIPEREVIMQQPDGTFIQVDYSPSRNNYRLPPSHRLNIGVNFRKQLRHGERIWNLGLYNAYNRMNPNFVFYSSSEESGIDTGLYRRKEKLKKLTILPIIPSFSYTWNF